MQGEAQVMQAEMYGPARLKHAINLRERDRNVHVGHFNLANDAAKGLIAKGQLQGVSLNKAS